MSEPTNPSEFLRYRQALSSAYLLVVSLGVLLLSSSVVHALFIHDEPVQLKGAVLSADRPDPDALLRCNDDVSGLLEGIVDMAGQVARGERTVEHWETFSRRWLSDWNELNVRCRFSELAEHDMGQAYDHMALVHADLPAMRLKYQALLVRFDGEQAEQLTKMRAALRLSREELERRVGEVSPPPP